MLRARKGSETMTIERTQELVHAYYDSWKRGFERLDREKLRSVLAPDIVFESPVSRRVDASSLVEAIAHFSRSLKEVRFLQTIVSGNEAAVIYDCDLRGPVDSLRFGEFFRAAGDRIGSIRLVFDATAYRKM